MQTESIFTRFWSWLTGEAAQLPTLASNVLAFADKVTNEIKTISASELPTFLTTLGTIASSVDPALSPLISGLENYIPKAVGLITGVTNDVTGAVKALQSGKLEDAAVYAGNLGTLKGAITNFVLTNNTDVLGVAPEPGHTIAVALASHVNTPA